MRPCLRCRPECAPGLAVVDAVGRLAGAALAGIEERRFARVTDLAEALQISPRHLRRVTAATYGVTPGALLQTQRLLLAKRLLSETSLRATDIAFASGFGSLRRFNAVFKSRYGLAPRALRRSAPHAEPAKDSRPGLRCRLDFRPPFAWQALLEYLRARAIPGVESVQDGIYRRTVGVENCSGWIAVAPIPGGTALEVELSASLAPVVGAVLGRIARLCDLGALPHAVGEVLGQDAQLRALVRRLPGLRVPGAFDGHEIAVRAILGQQISVRAATTLAGRWAAAFGEPLQTPFASLTRLAPGAERMARVHPGELCACGVVRARATAIVALARTVLDGKVRLACVPDVPAQIEALQRVAGIGPWTAQYIAMRALGWPDAFPYGDLQLLRAAGVTARELHSRSQAWRPWRAYAAHYLWQSLAVRSIPAG